MGSFMYQIENRRGFVIPLVFSTLLSLVGFLWAIFFIVNHFWTTEKFVMSMSVGLGIFFSGVTMLYTIEQISRPPINNPFRYVNFHNSLQQDPNTKKERVPILVCLGDSLTHGACSANWTDTVHNTFCNTPLNLQPRQAIDAKRGESNLIVVNAGQNNICSWTIWKERVEPVLNFEPEFIVLMIGTNDLRAIYNKLWSWHLVQMWGLPEAPSLDKLKYHVQSIITRMLENLPKVKQIGVCTLPPMGEDLVHHPANQIVRDANKIIRTVVTEMKNDRVTILPVYEKLEEEINRAHLSNKQHVLPVSVDYFIPMAVWMDVSYCMLGISWNTLGRCSGNVVLSDSLHLNERGGDVVAAIVANWLTGKGQLEKLNTSPIHKTVKSD